MSDLLQTGRGGQIGFGDHPDNRAVHWAVNPGEKGDQWRIGIQYQRDDIGLAGAGEQCTVQAAVFQIFPGVSMAAGVQTMARVF